MSEPLRRADDRGWLCLIAHRASQGWNWFDRRQIDSQMVALAVLYLTFDLAGWAMAFADHHPDMDGLKMAAIIAAVLGPWTVLQGAVVKFYFDARKGSFLPNGGPK